MPTRAAAVRPSNAFTRRDPATVAPVRSAMVRIQAAWFAVATLQAASSRSNAVRSSMPHSWPAASPAESSVRPSPSQPPPVLTAMLSCSIVQSTWQRLPGRFLSRVDPFQACGNLACIVRRGTLRGDSNRSPHRGRWPRIARARRKAVENRIGSRVVRKIFAGATCWRLQACSVTMRISQDQL